MTETNAGHMSNADRQRRMAVEAELRLGTIDDFEPVSLDEPGLKAYHAIVKAIHKERLATVDGFIVETAADALGKMQQLRDVINEQGIVTEKGSQNTALNAYQKYSEIARKFLTELGCSPSARAKIANDAVAAVKRGPTIRELMNMED